MAITYFTLHTQITRRPLSSFAAGMVDLGAVLPTHPMKFHFIKSPITCFQWLLIPCTLHLYFVASLRFQMLLPLIFLL